jgi:hypothetical protein
MKNAICCFAILSIILVGAPAQAQAWELYDHFKGGFLKQGFIDANKWNGFVYPTAFPPALFRGENGMELQFDRLRIHNHDYTGDVSGLPPGVPISPTATSFSSEQNLYLNLEDPGLFGVKGLKATLNVLRAEAFSPPACLPQTFPYTAARARVFGSFFQTMVPVPGTMPVTSVPADVNAFIIVERASGSSDPFYTLNVMGSISACTHSSNCTAYIPIKMPFKIDTVHLWENFDVSVYWDEPGSQFIYQLNGTKVYVPYNLDDSLPAKFSRKAISAINIFTKCQDQEASMDVLFDNVQISRY